MINETRKRGRRLMLIGLVLAVLSGLLVNRQLSQAMQPEPLTAVIYVATPIGPQRSIRSALVDAAGEEAAAVDVCPAGTEERSTVVGAFQVCFIPSRFRPQHAVPVAELTAEELSDSQWVRQTIENQIGDQFTLLQLERGDIVQTNFLGASDLDAGLREISIAIDPVTSVGSKVLPGQRVDVVVSYEKSVEGLPVPVTELLLQDVEVRSPTTDNLYTTVEGEEEFGLASGQSGSRTSVILAVSLADAMRLTHMANFATEVRLIVRRPDDRATHEMPPITLINP